jgi:1-deoxy-D-xylulose-5-phosphate synthase
MDKLLDSINGPQDLRGLTVPQLKKLADEVRELIVEVVAQNGGHLASNLGVVELTIALHYSFDFLKDKLVWDVGHQAYAHKILTGRREAFRSLRQAGGISGFADKKESPYDTFSFGHTGTSVSAGLGLAFAGEALKQDARVVVVIGDGAIASGMPLEALNHAGVARKKLLVILNDNRMSISPTVGALAGYLSRVRASDPYMRVKKEVVEFLANWRRALDGVDTVYHKMAEGVQAALTPGGLFVELGFHYYGPVDGHDLAGLLDTLERMKKMEGPVLLHVLTEKGHGFQPATADPAGWHSSGTFKVENGKVLPAECAESEGEAREPKPMKRSYSDVAGQTLVQLAGEEPRLVAITAAMRDGTGLTEFARLYPDRFFDVGICEQHAVGFAGGLAAGGMKPVLCVYSTFLQRAFDQIHHDIALQGHPVVFCVDRAGVVGSDGATHHGHFDVACFRCMPGFVVMAPADGEELQAMLRLALTCSRPCAVRYPREDPPERVGHEAAPLELGRALVLRTGKDGAIIAYGSLVSRALAAADALAGEGRSITVVNARFAKPLDEETVLRVVREHPGVLVAEEHALAGGFGAAVLETLAAHGAPGEHVRLCGLPDAPVLHAPREEQLAQLGLDAPGLADRLRVILQKADA